LPVREANILANENRKSFSYELNLPSELSPGLHTGEVFAMQLPSGSSSEGSQILATLAVVTQVYLYVPYPGKYANAKMYIYGANVGEKIRFVIPVVSVGEFDLTSVRANVDIFNKLGNKVDSFQTNSVSVSITPINIVWTPGFSILSGKFIVAVNSPPPNIYFLLKFTYWDRSPLT
jgi:hypothetical protein